MSKKGENTHDITLILIFIKKYFIRLKFYKKNYLIFFLKAKKEYNPFLDYPLFKIVYLYLILVFFI